MWCPFKARETCATTPVTGQDLSDILVDMIVFPLTPFLRFLMRLRVHWTVPTLFLAILRHDVCRWNRGNQEGYFSGNHSVDTAHLNCGISFCLVAGCAHFLLVVLSNSPRRRSTQYDGVSCRTQNTTLVFRCSSDVRPRQRTFTNVSLMCLSNLLLCHSVIPRYFCWDSICPTKSTFAGKHDRPRPVICQLQRLYSEPFLNVAECSFSRFVVYVLCFGDNNERQVNSIF